MIPWSLVARYPHQHLHAAKFSAGITCHSTLPARIFSVFLSFFPETGPAANPLSTAHALRKYTTSILHTEGEIKMNTNQKRTLTIICTEGNEVTKKQHACFVHNLIADLSKPKPLIQWRRSNSKDGIVYCSNGLAEGTLMTLRKLTDTPGAEFAYSRHGNLIYTATETNGDVNCDMHLAHLLHKVTAIIGSLGEFLHLIYLIKIGLTCHSDNCYKREQ
jgi:hypothetical protein